MRCPKVGVAFSLTCRGSPRFIFFFCSPRRRLCTFFYLRLPLFTPSLFCCYCSSCYSLPGQRFMPSRRWPADIINATTIATTTTTTGAATRAPRILFFFFIIVIVISNLRRRRQRLKFIFINKLTNIQKIWASQSERGGGEGGRGKGGHNWHDKQFIQYIN